MKKIALVCIVLLPFLAVHAQEENFHKQELKVSCGTPSWIYNLMLERNEKFYFTASVAYLYRPIKWLWFGANAVNYFGNKIYYNVREYNTSGEFHDFTKSKKKYAFALAPEVRFSYINKKECILYSSLSNGWCWENGYDLAWRKYPYKRGYMHITWLGFSVNFGENHTSFLGCELGSGFKGLFNFHGGYRF